MRAAFAIAVGLSFGPTLAQAQPANLRDEIRSGSSLRRIRAELERTPVLVLDVSDETPHFQITIREPQRFRDQTPLHSAREPVPPGGLYAFEARQQVGPQMTPPLVVIDMMPIARAFAGAIQSGRSARRRTAAREEMMRAVEAYCEAQQDRGAGIQMCSISAAIR